MKNLTHTITHIENGSIAEELGIVTGDILVSINGETIEDVFDYKYLLNDNYVEVLILKENNEEWLLEVDKEFNEDLGIEFENGLMDEYRSCHNKCMFCFIDQMPKGMRETLYFKDDDSRLSFLQGNYITLTNMKKEHIDRILKFRLEPINISVHTTNPELRNKMLNNRFSGEALKYLDEFHKLEITMNAQIVLCKGVNDGEELDKTIEDLSKYLPYMKSLSVVPVGLTKYREGLYPLEPFSKEDAVKVIDIIDKWQKILIGKTGYHFAHASDEWYILADRPIPEAKTYDGYLQLENGVGMLRLLIDEIDEVLAKESTKTIDEINTETISVATGVLVFPYMEKIIEKVTCKFKDMKVNLYKIENEFFGKNITVSGLLTGSDIIKVLKGKELGERLLLPINMFKSGETIFLDDVTLSDVEEQLNTKIVIVRPQGRALIEAILRKER